MLNEEYGYEKDTITPPNEPDDVRWDHWAIACAGGYGSYGDKTKGPKIGVYFSSVSEDAVGTIVPDQLAHLHRLFSGIPYWTMEPANALVTSGDTETVFCLARPGEEYVVYASQGGSFGLNLTHVNGRMKATWLNPRTGETTAGDDVLISWNMEDIPGFSDDDFAVSSLRERNNVPFQAPDDGVDWVLHLQKDPSG